ncbi:flagellar basal body-associated FliL family protein [Sphingomonas baiyangensis]|uniref:Flagellar protein FliL n=1 Tax=Sphingomonas baiyangensis TaxID=2572576 RepID=A0A4U1L6Z6_9SPHN|nr:flagellar basal body-associated FliL family protein [Sphingomonas baiyangensis]TKD52006.1 flagellar basal body-associated FliL family protein [Sphingomonas baiyangensis]
MSDKKEAADAPAKKKGGKMKWVLIALGGLVLVGGGVGGGLYATGALAGDTEAEASGPRLVPKSEEKRAESKDGEGGGEAPPVGEGGEKYASTYYAMEKEFTSNLRDSVHFVQVGIAVSTHYDDSVIESLKTHEIAVRSAVLLALGETDEEMVFTSEGKRQLQKRLTKAINDVLKEKQGFGGIGNVYFTNFVVQ